MKKKDWITAILFLSGCAEEQKPVDAIFSKNMMWNNNEIEASEDVLGGGKSAIQVAYSSHIRQAARCYNVDEVLIRAIIQVESGFNPNAVSASNAVGLMQVKPASAGRDVYRFRGISGQPSLNELRNPAVNIDLGTAYINIIQNQQLCGIKNPKTLRYATIVAYVNGAGAMLRIFALDKSIAVGRINQMTPDEFYWYIQKRHPAPQAPRYLSKVIAVYKSML